MNEWKKLPVDQQLRELKVLTEMLIQRVLFISKPGAFPRNHKKKTNKKKIKKFNLSDTSFLKQSGIKPARFRRTAKNESNE